MKEKEESKTANVALSSYCDSEVGAGVPHLDNNPELSVNMVNVDISQNQLPQEKSIKKGNQNEVKPQSPKQQIRKNKKIKKRSIFCCGKRYDSDDE